MNEYLSRKVNFFSFWLIVGVVVLHSVVQTSAFEGLGRTLIEASILCKPIVTTNFPTAYGLVEDGKTGFITEMQPEKIAESIKLLHTDKKLYLKMIETLSSKTDNEKQKTLEKVYTLFDE